MSDGRSLHGSEAERGRVGKTAATGRFGAAVSSKQQQDSKSNA